MQWYNQDLFGNLRLNFYHIYYNRKYYVKVHLRKVSRSFPDQFCCRSTFPKVNWILINIWCNHPKNCLLIDLLQLIYSSIQSKWLKQWERYDMMVAFQMHQESQPIPCMKMHKEIQPIPYTFGERFKMHEDSQPIPCTLRERWKCLWCDFMGGLPTFLHLIWTHPRYIRQWQKGVHLAKTDLVSQSETCCAPYQLVPVTKGNFDNVNQIKIFL